MKSWKGAGDISRRSKPRKSEAFEEENNAEDHDPVHYDVIVYIFRPRACMQNLRCPQLSS